MKDLNIYLILILLLIKSYKTERFNYSFVNSEENDNDYDNGFEEIDEFTEQFYNKANYENSMLNLRELMKQPILPGIADENWPYPEDEDPFSQYNRDGCKKCECGSISKKRIVNGSFAKRDEFPWQVLITYKRRFNCGASLINDRHVLTAGHCVRGYPPKALQLRFGALRKAKGIAVYRKIDRTWVASGFSMKNLKNDAAIIKLQTRIRFTDNVRPICLPKDNSDYSGKLATVTGWGAIYFGGPPSEVLKKAQVAVLTNKQCQKTGYKKAIKSNHLCAGNRGVDACSGDSGGPLITLENNKYKQIGIVSFGKGCNKPNFPGVYTRVTKFKQHIMQVASKSGSCWCKG